MEAYLYKWTETTTGKWYIGCRTAKGCHINDGYICSSKIVKPLILENRNNWIREILCIGHPDYIRFLEARLLAFLNAADDPLSYNQYNNDLKFFLSDEKRIASGRRLGSIPHTPEWNEKIRQAKIGTKRQPFSEEWKQNLSKAGKGRPKSETFKQNLSQARIKINNQLWQITKPDGTQQTTNCLLQWCREEFGGLANSAATNLRYKPYKGYTAVKLTSCQQSI